MKIRLLAVAATAIAIAVASIALVAGSAALDAPRPTIAQDRIPFPHKRKIEMKRYANRHYGLSTYLLKDPKVIVEHYTANESYEATYNTFAPDVPDSELHELPGLCAHFVVDKQGVIHQLVSLRLMCRHTVGLNWTAIGIEHVGTSAAEVLGNRRQIEASLRLTRWLQSRYGIKTRNVIGHAESLSSPYHHERVSALKHQTHSDFRHPSMEIYRRRLVRSTRAGAVTRHRIRLGRSAEGRPIEAVEIGDPDSRRKTLVFGVIHGDETAGAALAGRLAKAAAPPGSDLWVVRDLNPDGVATHRRQNARGVDLNRNFPWHWRPIGRRGDQQYAGPRPLSEPETRVARALVRRLRPRVTIWFHQPLALVDRSGGDVAVERRFARLSGLPLRHIGPYPGTATSWQNHRLHGTTAFVVELPPGHLRPPRLARYARAVLALVR